MENIISTAGLQIQITQLKKRNSELESKVAELSALVKHYEELFKLSQHRRFGASSEKSNEAQLNIFEISEKDESIASDEAEIKGITYKHRKQKGKREADLSKLPLEVVEHDIPESERNCPECGETMSELGAETRDEIKIIPAKVIHVQHRRKVYKCNNCAKSSFCQEKSVAVGQENI